MNNLLKSNEQIPEQKGSQKMMRTRLSDKFPLYFGHDDYALILPLKPFLGKKAQNVLTTFFKVMEVLEEEARKTGEPQTVIPINHDNE